MELQRGDPLPVPCRYCGKFLKFKVESGVFNRSCESCHKVTVVTCREQGGEWTIRTAPDGSLIRRS